MKKITYIILLVQLTIVLAACSRRGDTGDRGPSGTLGPNGAIGMQGPTGPQGPVGPAGPVGPIGPQGAAGIANVTYSGWATSTAVSWVTTNANFYGARFIYDRAAPGITANIMNQGVVLAYIRTIPGGVTAAQVAQLPFRIRGGTGSISHHLDYSLNAAGNLRFLYKFNGASGAYTTATLGTVETRYILISGTMAGSRFISGPVAGYDIAQIKAMEYNQVLSLFNIPENGSNEK